MPALEKRSSLDTNAFNAAVSLEVSQLAAAQLPDTLADLHQFSDGEDEALRTEQDLQSKFENPRAWASLARLAGLAEDDDATVGARLGRALRATPAALRRRFPAIEWVPRYTWSLLRADLVAGLTVGVVLIPQGVAYAMLAELPPIYGLYAALAPLPVYAAMGSSRHMSIGPFALVSLLVADAAGDVVDPDADGMEAYIDAVMCLSMMVGTFLLLMATLRLGARNSAQFFAAQILPRAKSR